MTRTISWYLAITALMAKKYINRHQVVWYGLTDRQQVWTGTK